MSATGVIRVLHVDDEPDFADVAATFLRREKSHFEIETATSASDGLDCLSKADFDCIVSDYDMPVQNGIEFLEAVREESPDIPFILFTGKGGEEIASDAISAGVSDYLQKGSGTDRYSLLANRISNLVSQYRAQRQLEIHARQQQQVADLGKEALADVRLETLFDRAVRVVADTLDNEYAKVLEYRPEHGNLFFRAGIGWRDGLVGEATVGTDDDSQAGYTIRSEEPVVVEDLRTEKRFRGPPLLVEHDVVSGISVIIGSADDPWGVLGTHTTEQTAFTDDDITFVQNIAHILANAIQRTQREEEIVQSEARYRAVAENFPNGIVALFDDDLRYEIVHGTAFGNMDLTAEMMEGRRVPDIFSDDIAEQLVPKYRAALAGEYSTFEMRFQGRLYRVHTVPIDVGSQGMLMSQDITDETEDKRQLETLLNNFPGYIYRHRYETDWPLEFVKGSAEEVTGYTAEELEQDVALAEKIIHPADREYVWTEVEKGLEAGGQYTLTYRIITKGGSERWIWERGKLVEDPITGDEKLEGFIIDFTDRKERERELEETNAILSTLFETLPVGVLAEDDSRNVLAANERLFELFEMPGTPAEIIGGDCEQMAERVSDMFVDAEGFIDRINELVANRESTDNEKLALRDERRFERSYRPIRLPTEDGHLWVYRDITARTQRTQEREATIDFLQNLYDVATDVKLTTQEKITQLLELGTEKLELPYGHLTRIERAEDEPKEGTQTIIEASGGHELLQPGDSSPLSRSYCRKTIERNELLVIQDAFAAGWSNDPAYETFNLACYIGTAITVNDGLYGTVFFASDTPRENPFTDAERALVQLMSRLVSYELERKQATCELKQQNERLEKFASVVSHDLRNPLTVAEGHLELSREECDSEHLDVIAKAHDRIGMLIEDLLSLARQKEEVTDFEPVDLGGLTEYCWWNVDTTGATLVVSAGCTITADRSRLAQLLENLIHNAVKHGGDEVTITVGELDEGFYVADDGSGIPADEHERIFESGYSTINDGTGFGLAIVQEIVEAHGWDIRVTESDSGGARFEITGVEFAAQ